MKTKLWKFEPSYNKITAIDPGNCRVTITEKIHGLDYNDWLTNGKLMAMAPEMAEFILAVAKEKLPTKISQQANALVYKLKSNQTACMGGEPNDSL